MKGYGFLSFAKNMGKKIGENISKNVSTKYSQKCLHHSKQSASDAFKTASIRIIEKTAEATVNLIGNKIAIKRMTKVSKNPQSNLETVTNEHDNEIPKERYLSPEEDRKLLMI